MVICITSYSFIGIMKQFDAFQSCISVSEAFPPTILTLGAGGRFDSHFWTQSGAPSPYLAFRAPPRFQAIYGVESVPRFQPIFGTQSAPPPAFKLYMVLKACPPPLSTHIWHSERPPAFKLYMVLRACPAFNPYLAFRAPPRFQAIFCVESGPIFSV